MPSILITNARVVSDGREFDADVRIEGETLIAKLKPGSWNVLVTRATK